MTGTESREVAMPRVVFATFLALLVGVASGAGFMFAQRAQADAFAVTALIACVSSVLTLLLYVPATILRPIEWVIWAALFILFLVFYEPWLELLLQTLHAIAPRLGEYPLVCQQAVAAGWIFVRRFLPASWPVVIGQTFSPIWILFSGLLLRLGIYRWAGAGLRRHARAHWLWITAYLCGLVMLAAVSPWHFWTLFLLSAACGLVIIAGVTQVLSDALRFSLSFLWALLRTINVFLRWIVFGAVWISRQFMRFIRHIRQLYYNYITQPIQRVLERLHNRVESWRSHVIKRTQDLDKAHEDDTNSV